MYLEFLGFVCTGHFPQKQKKRSVVGFASYQDGVFGGMHLFREIDVEQPLFKGFCRWKRKAKSDISAEITNSAKAKTNMAVQFLFLRSCTNESLLCFKSELIDKRIGSAVYKKKNVNVSLENSPF